MTPEFYITIDGAQSWKEVTPPEALPSDSQIQIQGAFLDKSTAWVVFSNNNQIAPEAVVWHTTDSGHTWIASAPLRTTSSTSRRAASCCLATSM